MNSVEYGGPLRSSNRSRSGSLATASFSSTTDGVHPRGEHVGAAGMRGAGDVAVGGQQVGQSGRGPHALQRRARAGRRPAPGRPPSASRRRNCPAAQWFPRPAPRAASAPRRRCRPARGRAGSCSRSRGTGCSSRGSRSHGWPCSRRDSARRSRSDSAWRSSRPSACAPRRGGRAPGTDARPPRPVGRSASPSRRTRG